LMGPRLLRGPRGWMGRSVDATTPTDRGGSSRQYAVGTHARNPKRRASHPRNPRLACRAGRRGLALSRSVGARGGGCQARGVPYPSGTTGRPSAAGERLSLPKTASSFPVATMWTSAGLISRGQTNPDSPCCPAGLYRGRSRAGCAACSRGMRQIRPSRTCRRVPSASPVAVAP